MLQRTSFHPRNIVLDDLLYLVDKSGLPMCAVERQAGLSSNTLSRWKRNVHGANLDRVCAIGEALGYELQWVKK